MVTPRESYEKISPTAKFVAYLRTFTDIPFAKEMAEESGAEKIFARWAGENSETLIRSAPRFEARYKLTNRIILQRGVTQILEVAAGLSPRGLAMSENPAVVYVVTDLPNMLEQEKEIAEIILSSIKARRPNLHFQAGNALDHETLLNASTIFRANEPVAIITEGLLPYLSRKEKEVLASNIHKIIGKHGGVWVTSDVETKQCVEEWTGSFAGVGKRLTDFSNLIGRDVESNRFADDNDLKQFFKKAGFEINEERSYSSVVTELSSIRTLNLTKEEEAKIQRALGIFKTLILTSRNA